MSLLLLVTQPRVDRKRSRRVHGFIGTTEVDKHEDEHVDRMRAWALLDLRFELLDRGTAQALSLDRPALHVPDERELRKQPGADDPRRVVIRVTQDPKATCAPANGRGQPALPVGDP